MSTSSQEDAFRASLRGFKGESAGEAPRTASAVLGSAFEMLQRTVQGAVPARITDALADPIAAQTCGLTRWQRLIAFAALLAGGAACLGLAFLTLPMLVLRPGKFAVSYTVGSVLVLASFAMLTGPVAYAKSLVANDRVAFTAVYFGSLGMTLYSAIFAYNYFFVVLCALVQLVAMLWYVASFFPGGVAAFSFVSSLFTRSARSVLPI
eukprot:Unigene11137_Nuclearia_a/m.34087 Unigene11137_Nuclearia_a/g.34087  ORF Unigene11137_Nuclearia_a/g.34087 Unigene11137_Nuclearia_a/m.34087 type:complete len:208 (+) Unigene11137_Nuclearia_a:102-725(+)